MRNRSPLECVDARRGGATRYDEDAVRDSYYTEPFPTDQSEGEFYYYYYKYYASWTTPP